MMKNTEWGAVAYLSYSAYGIQDKVRINNNSLSITGYAANNEPTCGNTGTNEECNRYCNDGTCNTAYPNSVLASTTGNIAGVFDMAGDRLPRQLHLGHKAVGPGAKNSWMNFLILHLVFLRRFLV